MLSFRNRRLSNFRHKIRCDFALGQHSSLMSQSGSTIIMVWLFSLTLLPYLISACASIRRSALFPRWAQELGSAWPATMSETDPGIRLLSTLHHQSREGKFNLSGPSHSHIIHLAIPHCRPDMNISEHKPLQRHLRGATFPLLVI